MFTAKQVKRIESNRLQTLDSRPVLVSYTAKIIYCCNLSILLA